MRSIFDRIIRYCSQVFGTEHEVWIAVKVLIQKAEQIDGRLLVDTNEYRRNSMIVPYVPCDRCVPGYAIVVRRSGVVGVTRDEAIGVEPPSTWSLNNSTVAPDSTAAVRVSELRFVILSASLDPLSLLLARSSVKGTAGAALSKSKETSVR